MSLPPSGCGYGVIVLRILKLVQTLHYGQFSRNTSVGHGDTSLCGLYGRQSTERGNLLRTQLLSILTGTSIRTGIQAASPGANAHYLDLWLFLPDEHMAGLDLVGARRKSPLTSRTMV